MMMDDYDGQMIFGELGGLKVSDICLTGEEKPRKTSSRKTVPTGIRIRARCVAGAHPTACPTPMDDLFRSFKVCLDAKERVGCGKQQAATAHIRP